MYLKIFQSFWGRKYKNLFSNGLNTLKNQVPYLLELQFIVRALSLEGKSHCSAKVFAVVKVAA